MLINSHFNVQSVSKEHESCSPLPGTLVCVWKCGFACEHVEIFLCIILSISIILSLIASRLSYSERIQLTFTLLMHKLRSRFRVQYKLALFHITEGIKISPLCLKFVLTIFFRIKVKNAYIVKRLDYSQQRNIVYCFTDWSRLN